MFTRMLFVLAVASVSSAAYAQQGPTAKAGFLVEAEGPASAARALPGRAKSAVLAPLALSTTSFSAVQPILRNLQDAATYKYLVLAAERTGLIELLQGGPYTVFAPDDAAFGRLPAGLLDALWQPANRARLRTVIATHIVAGNLQEADLTPGRVLTTAAGTTLTVRRVNGRLALEDPAGKRAYLAAADQASSNGTVHTTTAVLGVH